MDLAFMGRLSVRYNALMVNEVNVSSIDDLVFSIRDALTNQPSPLWFRGQRDADWGVVPSLWRPSSTGTYTTNDERNFNHRFRTRAAIRYAAAPQYDDHAGWLSIMQHYGLPTRLLDWSRSPLVAAYFAVGHSLRRDPSLSTDAAIWMLAPHQLNLRHAGTEVTPALGSGMCDQLVRPAFVDDMTHADSSRAQTVIAAMATETDLRMFVQQGCFTVHSPDAEDLRHLPDSKRFLWKLRIGRHTVLRMAEDLRTLGFSSGDLFPDLEHLADEFKNEYPPGSTYGSKH